MIWDVAYSDESIRDLEELYAYVAFELSAPESARKLVEKIMARADSLETFPMRFARYPVSPLREGGVRFVAVDNYLIFYRPDEHEHAVHILRVLFGGSDVVSRLGSEDGD